jgi:hypothetical protein
MQYMKLSTAMCLQMDRWKALVAEPDSQQFSDLQVCNIDSSCVFTWKETLIPPTIAIYRELRSEEEDLLAAAMESKPKVEAEEVDELSAPTEGGMTSQQEAGASSSSVPDSNLRNITGGMELLPNRKEGGLTKKTISVAGLHMISCK